MIEFILAPSYSLTQCVAYVSVATFYGADYLKAWQAASLYFAIGLVGSALQSFAQ